MNKSGTNHPRKYETKFASFIQICQQAKQDHVPAVIVANPQVLGDTYEELIESLSRLAEAKLSLQIVSG